MKALMDIDFSDNDEEGDEDDEILLEKTVFLYAIPNLTAENTKNQNSGQKEGSNAAKKYKASEWDIANPVKTCKLVLIAAGPACHIQLESCPDEKDSQENLQNHSVFGQSVITTNYDAVIQPTADSSRYFVFKFQNIKGEYERMGLGFIDRTDSQDLIKILKLYFTSENKDAVISDARKAILSMKQELIENVAQSEQASTSTSTAATASTTNVSTAKPMKSEPKTPQSVQKPCPASKKKPLNVPPNVPTAKSNPKPLNAPPNASTAKANPKPNQKQKPKPKSGTGGGGGGNTSQPKVDFIPTNSKLRECPTCIANGRTTHLRHLQVDCPSKKSKSNLILLDRQREKIPDLRNVSVQPPAPAPPPLPLMNQRVVPIHPINPWDQPPPILNPNPQFVGVACFNMDFTQDPDFPAFDGPQVFIPGPGPCFQNTQNYQPAISSNREIPPLANLPSKGKQRSKKSPATSSTTKFEPPTSSNNRKIPPLANLPAKEKRRPGKQAASTSGTSKIAECRRCKRSGETRGLALRHIPADCPILKEQGVLPNLEKIPGLLSIRIKPELLSDKIRQCPVCLSRGIKQDLRHLMRDCPTKQREEEERNGGPSEPVWKIQRNNRNHGQSFDNSGPNNNNIPSLFSSNNCDQGPNYDDSNGPPMDGDGTWWQHPDPRNFYPNDDRGNGGPNNFDRNYGPDDFGPDGGGGRGNFGPPNCGPDNYGPDDFVPNRGPDNYDSNYGPRSGPDNYGPGNFGPNRGPDNFGPNDGPDNFGPNRGPDNYGPNRGPDNYGPNRGPDNYGPNRGPDNYGPNRGPDNYGPNRGPDNYGPNRGPDNYGPNRGPDNFGPNRGPDNFGPNRGSNRGPDNFGPNRGPEFYGPDSYGPNDGPDNYGPQYGSHCGANNYGPADFSPNRGPDMNRYDDGGPTFDRNNYSGPDNYGPDNYGPDNYGPNDGPNNNYDYDDGNSIEECHVCIRSGNMYNLRHFPENCPSRIRRTVMH